MFEKLKKALSSLKAAIAERELGDKELEDLLYRFSLELLEGDVAQEVVDELSLIVKERLKGERVKRGEDASKVVEEALKDEIRRIVSIPKPDLLKEIERKRREGEPYSILFLGVNGTGKTTTLAKLAYMLKRKGYSVLLTCSDTYRAGAIEQLAEHAKRLSLKMISQRYGADPAAVARDAITYAKKHDVDVVLIDTAGRMQTSRNLMDEMKKIVRVVHPDLKIFVGDALTGNDAVYQARAFLEQAGFDCVILTKVDADVRGGSALSIAFTTKRPIIFVGTGQGYEDLEPFDANRYIEQLFGS